MLTDVIQFVIQLAMSLVVLVVALGAVGGWSGLWEKLPSERAGIFNAEAGMSVEFWLVYVVVIIFSYNGGTWGLAQRFVSVESPRDAQKAATLSGILYLFYPLAIFIPAWAAPFILPESFNPTTLMAVEGFNPEHTYIAVTQKILGGMAPGLIGLFVCSMFAATMSMIDSDINALAAVFTKDVYQRNFNRAIGDKALFKVGMIATVTFGLLVIVSAVLIAQSDGAEKVFNYTVKLFGGLLPPIAIPLMFGMIFKRPTARGAILALVGGFITYLILTQYSSRFEICAGGEMLVSLILYFGEGYICKRSDEKEKEVEEVFERITG